MKNILKNNPKRHCLLSTNQTIKLHDIRRMKTTSEHFSLNNRTILFSLKKSLSNKNKTKYCSIDMARVHI